MNHIVLYEIQEHHQQHWEQVTEHWGQHRRRAQEEADRMNNSGRVGSSPLSRPARNAQLLPCTTSCVDCAEETAWFDALVAAGALGEQKGNH